jgi:hypothetical protein
VGVGVWVGVLWTVQVTGIRASVAVWIRHVNSREYFLNELGAGHGIESGKERNEMMEKEAGKKRPERRIRKNKVANQFALQM